MLVWRSTMPTLLGFEVLSFEEWQQRKCPCRAVLVAISNVRAARKHSAFLSEPMEGRVFHLRSNNGSIVLAMHKNELKLPPTKIQQRFEKLGMRLPVNPFEASGQSRRYNRKPRPSKKAQVIEMDWVGVVPEKRKPTHPAKVVAPRLDAAPTKSLRARQANGAFVDREHILPTELL